MKTILLIFCAIVISVGIILAWVVVCVGHLIIYGRPARIPFKAVLVELIWPCFANIFRGKK